ncbi:lysylphosphatidylglycerol synthase transmembrane domain-containing protein [Vibrio ulleungensis]|uniref:Flippase-like domain-containing protein n=1 Tax=Vibrio ulleungensis TaxID=2807619 RepID=A0ABS2HPE7_9VIBR|nr:lysylphosphatidylglycerol synthase transmembrane domain-containing protein [Vibrio ulleungensis]MBM7038063.1 flippase-like domain-containing protein [Vibrio ulleungensis]
MRIKFYVQKLKRLYLWLALGFVIYIAWTHSSDFSGAIGSIQSLPVGLVILCLMLSGLSYSCRSLRWLGYMRQIEQKASIYLHILIYLSGFAFTASPGKTGELMRGTHLNELGIQFRYTFLSFMSERLLDVIVVLLLGTYFLIKHFNLAFSSLSLVMLFLPFIIVLLLHVLPNLASSKSWFFPIVILRGLWRLPVALKSQLFTLVAWTAQGLILYLMLINFGVEISIAMAVSIYCLSLLIGAASLFPGGIGVTEVGMIWLLTKVDVGSDIAIITSLLTRMLTLWPAMLIGLACAFVLKKSKAGFFVSSRI